MPVRRREDPTRLKQSDIEEVLARFDASWAVVTVNFDFGLDDTTAGVRAAGGELVWREVPYQSETAIGDIALWDDLGNDGLLQALTARSAGPGLEIYRLP